MRAGWKSGVVLGAAIAVLMAWTAATAAGQAAPAGVDTAADAAYVAGYQAGYGLGQQDQAAGVSANAHKFRVYQDGTAGYTPGYGTPEAYRAGFQSGFEDGYGDGYAGRPLSIGAIGASPPEPAGGGEMAGAVKEARANGYREGYGIGESDANRRAGYAATASSSYTEAMTGYRRELGEANQYQLNFRSGFSMGYDDGYHHHLYNAAVGARRPTPTPAAGGANDLPTDPEQLRERPSGVYDNGVLLAAGTRVQATLEQGLDTKTAQVGDRFRLTVTVPVWVGAVAAIPAGSTIQGTVEEVQRGGLLSGHAQLQLQYTTLTIPGQAPRALNATTLGVGQDAVDQSEGTVNGQSADTGRHAATGAAIGAVVGGIFGGGGGLIRGGMAGAAAGTAGVLVSHKRDLALRPGEPFLVRLERPLELPKNAGANGSQ